MIDLIINLKESQLTNSHFSFHFLRGSMDVDRMVKMAKFIQILIFLSVRFLFPFDYLFCVRVFFSLIAVQIVNALKIEFLWTLGRVGLGLLWSFSESVYFAIKTSALQYRTV